MPTKDRTPRVHQMWRRDQKAFFENTPDEDIYRMYTSPEVHRVILLRDPIERFVSGYFEKVVTGIMPKSARRNQFQATTQDIHRFLELSHTWIRNDHLGLQSNYCGLRNYGLRHWNIIRVYDKYHMQDVIKDLSERLNFAEHIHGWGEHGNESMYEVFTSHAYHGKSDPGKSFLTRSICYRLVHIFFEDYATFFPFISPPDCMHYPEDGVVSVDVALATFAKRIKKVFANRKAHDGVGDDDYDDYDDDAEEEEEEDNGAPE